MPEVLPTVATEVLLLVHVPPGNASVNAVVLPEHTNKEPVIAGGIGVTVTAIVE